jgi:hypothetical protein
MTNKWLTVSRLIALMEETHIGTPATIKKKIGADIASCFQFQFSSVTVSKRILKLSCVMNQPTHIIIQIKSLMFINHYCTVL